MSLGKKLNYIINKQKLIHFYYTSMFVYCFYGWFVFLSSSIFLLTSMWVLWLEPLRLFDWWAPFISSQLLSRAVVSVQYSLTFLLSKLCCQIHLEFVPVRNRLGIWPTAVWHRLKRRLHSPDGSSHSETLQNSLTAWKLTNGWKLKLHFQRRWCQFQFEVNQDSCTL